MTYFRFLAGNIENPTCDRSEFACFDESNQCLDYSVVCDGTIDCDNGKDEEPSICQCTADQVSFWATTMTMMAIMPIIISSIQFKNSIKWINILEKNILKCFCSSSCSKYCSKYPWLWFYLFLWWLNLFVYSILFSSNDTFCWSILFKWLSAHPSNSIAYT